MLRALDFGSQGPGYSTGDGIQLMTVQHFIEQSLSLSSYYHHNRA